VLAKGIINGGVPYEVRIISKDSQSNTNRASEVAADLVLKDKVTPPDFATFGLKRRSRVLSRKW
jgi:hypothetical protein